MFVKKSAWRAEVYPAAPAMQPVSRPLARQAVMPFRHKFLIRLSRTGACFLNTNGCIFSTRAHVLRSPTVRIEKNGASFTDLHIYGYTDLLTYLFDLTDLYSQISFCREFWIRRNKQYETCSIIFNIYDQKEYPFQNLFVFL